MKKFLFLLFFIPIVSFGQTDAIDRLKAIWIDELIEFQDITIRDIDWEAVFVPYYTDRNLRYIWDSRPGERMWPKEENSLKDILYKAGLIVGRYDQKKVRKDGSNRETDLYTSTTYRGDYIIGFECSYCQSRRSNWKYRIRLNNNKSSVVVGVIRFDENNKSYKNYEKAYQKYLKKRGYDLSRGKSGRQVLFEEIIKRYKN